MPNNMPREEILAIIKECAEKLGHPPSLPELTRVVEVSMRTLRKLFGSYGNALREAGLRPRRNLQLPMEALFKDWAKVTREMGKLPTVVEYENLGEFSTRPLIGRFRKWLNVPRGLYQYANRSSLHVEYADVLEIIRAGYELSPTEERIAMSTAGSPASPGDEPEARALILDDRPIYGAPLYLPGMAHAPTNEAGVLCLFAMLAVKLGFTILRMQSEFPDCEALRRVGKGRCQRLSVEFEFESRNFQLHMHDEKQCDLIVCWVHNWPECPIAVLELQTIVENRCGE
ncbi:MAG TPA: hypothetical protein VH724_21030 [Candidatus Angelobacter sp.]|nr:hypothetical protein [Candidatus Angelobacter sp.]